MQTRTVIVEEVEGNGDVWVLDHALEDANPELLLAGLNAPANVEKGSRVHLVRRPSDGREGTWMPEGRAIAEKVSDSPSDVEPVAEAAPAAEAPVEEPEPEAQDAVGAEPEESESIAEQDNEGEPGGVASDPS